MSHTEHGAKGLHHQAAAAHKETAHHEHIAVAAYYLAEQRGFKGGDPVVDWLAAETEIDAMPKNGREFKMH